jgi:glutaconyl-CoA decarboxylase
MSCTVKPRRRHYARRLVKEQDSARCSACVDKMNNLIKSYYDKSVRLLAKAGLVDEIVKYGQAGGLYLAFIGAAYQNPTSICAFHQMLTPRAIREWDSLK